MSWQPIDTAPKNKSVLVFLNGQQHVAWFQDDASDPDRDEDDDYESDLNQCWAVTDNKHGPFALRGGRPTHWMPLPEPPK